MLTICATWECLWCSSITRNVPIHSIELIYIHHHDTYTQTTHSSVQSQNIIYECHNSFATSLVSASIRGFSICMVNANIYTNRALCEGRRYCGISKRRGWDAGLFLVLQTITDPLIVWMNWSEENRMNINRYRLFTTIHWSICEICFVLHALMCICTKDDVDPWALNTNQMSFDVCFIIRIHNAFQRWF